MAFSGDCAAVQLGYLFCDGKTETCAAFCAARSVGSEKLIKYAVKLFFGYRIALILKAYHCVLPLY